MRSLRLMVGAALAAVAIAAAVPGVAAAQTITPYRPDDRTMGAANAPVTLTVYLSTTCGHCAEWHNEHFPEIKRKYVDTGKVRIVFRDLFTAPGEVSMGGAVMARCAAPARYDDVLSALFRTQAQYVPQGRDREWLQAAGAAGGLTREQMNACFSDEANLAAVSARNDRSALEGIRGTPSFFVNGQRVLATAHHADVAAFDAVLAPLLAGR